MKKKVYDYLEPFSDESGELAFSGAYIFPYKERNLILGNNGNIILLDDAIFDTLLDKDPKTMLWFKLMQRGLAIHKQRLPNEEKEHETKIMPAFFMIDMTNKCNIGCRYCLRETWNSESPRTLSRESAQAIVEFIIRYCNAHELEKVRMQPWGGEPLLVKDVIFFIQDKIKENGLDIDIDIETNGTLLSENVVRQLYDRHINYGISLDGFESLNDAQRVYRNGEGTYAKVIEGLNLTKKYYGEDICVLATITKQTVSYVGGIIEHFAKDLNLRRIKLNFVHQSFFREDTDFCLDKADVTKGVNEIIDKILEMNEQGISIMEYNFWIKIFNILTNRERDACLSRGCRGGRDMITIDVNGDIYPCDVTDFPEEKIGSIYSDLDLPEMVRDAMNKKSYYTVKSDEKCDTCPWKHFCNGGCTVRIKCAGGQRGMIDENECVANQVMYPRIIQLIQENPKLINRLIGFDAL